MNVHKNARSCPASRALLVKRVREQGWSVREASEAAGISDRRGREWIRRAAAGEELNDRSSRPRANNSIDEATRGRVVVLRQEWRTIRQIATAWREPIDGCASLSLCGTKPAAHDRAASRACATSGNVPGNCCTSISSGWDASIVSVTGSHANARSARRDRASSSSTWPPTTIHASRMSTSWLTSEARLPAHS